MMSWGPAHEQRKRWLMAIGGVLVFAVVGLMLAPGFARRERDTPPEPALLGAAPEHTARGAAEGGAGSRHRAGPATPQVSHASTGFHDFDCMIGPNVVIEIGSPVTGLIEAILVDRSDYVEAGQVLARLESTVEQAAARVAQARAQRTVEVESRQVSLDLGEKRRARAVELFEAESVSLDVREEVETKANLAALELELAKENHRLAALQAEQARATLERRTIRSPISGFVIERLMEPGEVVDEQTILRVAQTDPLRAEVILPSQLFGRVHPGDPAEIIPEAPLDQALRAEVAIADRVIDGASGTFGVRLLLPNPDHALPAGLRCRVSFLSDR